MISKLHLVLWALLAPTALSIYCFECDSSQHFSCTEFWDPTLIVTEQVGPAFSRGETAGFVYTKNNVVVVGQQFGLASRIRHFFKIWSDNQNVKYGI
jgi:hypothetical protein